MRFRSIMTGKPWMVGLIFFVSLVLSSTKLWAEHVPDPDLNNDGVVNVLDLSMVGSCFGLDPTTNPQCEIADITHDGVVDFGDLNFVLASFGQTGFPTDETVSVPDVAGLAQVDAEAAIVSENLIVGTISPANSTTVPAGDVISQDPAGGTQLAEGSAVDLVVSLGPPLVPVPAVVGLAQAEAEAAIVAANLAVGNVTTANSATVPAGDVISQSPAAGTQIAEGSAVDLVVSLGPVTVPVPDVVGLPQADAEAAITNANLAVGTVTTQNSDTVPAGDVISQDPAAGTQIAEGSAVDLVVSLGPALFPVPDVVGLSQADAEASIIAAGLTVGAISTASSDTVPAGDVISQNPASETAVPEGSAVDLVVSLGPALFPVPDVVGLPQADAEASIIAAGLTVGAISTANSDTVPAGDVISQNPVSGTTVPEGSGVDLLVSLGPEEVDTTPPNLLITKPVAGTFIIQNQPVIELTYSDASGVDIASLAFTANGNPLAEDCELGDTSASCTPTTPLPEGLVTLSASINDLVGNTATTQVEFTVDSLPVEISISAPAEGLITKDAEIEVTGTVGADVTSVTVNGVVATLGNSFSVTVPLREGTNMIVAVATKVSGKTGTDSVDVTRDIVAPIVRIDSPRDGFVSVNNVIAVTGRVNDIVNGATNALVIVNGIEATVAGGGFMVMDIPLVRGPNTIEAVATDAVGNVGRHSIVVTFQPPVGARISVASGNGQFVTVMQPLPEPLVAVVKDDLGNPAAGRVVRFEVTRNSGTLRINEGDEPKRIVQVPTDGNGLATVLFTLGDTSGEGNNRVRATSVGVAGEVEFCASGLAAVADKILMVMGDNQRGVVGNPLATPLEALVVDRDGNPIKDIPVTFAVVSGDGNLNGQQDLERFTGTDGIARAVLTLGLEPGINNNVVNATFPGLTGLPATFISSGLTPGNPEDTRFSGVVLDNGHTPIPGAIVSIPDTDPLVQDITDNEGQFLLENVPVGHIVLRIDPAASPRPETFPPLEFETVTVAGQTNILGQPILLPPLDTEGSKIVGGDDDITLNMKGVAGLELTVFANSVTCPLGTPDRSPDGKQCRVTISQVHLDKVPMPPPGGIIFMPPAWTIQPAGVKFDPPAPITIPNNGLPPGRVIDIFQFDHTLNQFINIGKGTVSEDGSVITSDPGFGITAAGWGGGGPPQPPTTDITGVSCPFLCTLEAWKELLRRLLGLALSVFLGEAGTLSDIALDSPEIACDVAIIQYRIEINRLILDPSCQFDPDCGVKIQELTNQIAKLEANPACRQ